MLFRADTNINDPQLNISVKITLFQYFKTVNFGLFVRISIYPKSFYEIVSKYLKNSTVTFLDNFQNLLPALPNSPDGQTRQSAGSDMGKEEKKNTKICINNSNFELAFLVTLQYASLPALPPNISVR